MKTLRIRWQRLVDEQGRTCSRCGLTETAVNDAVERLQSSLGELEIDVVLETEVLSPAAFAQDPLESNRLWIAGEPLEKWVSATPGRSACDTTCGDADCRTVTVDGRTCEAIPADLIVRAGLLAGAQLLHDEPAAGCSVSPGAPQESAGCGCR